ncbi:hypothetical protein DAKH74_043070 [Maudiozyma humilis]|uniref:PA14 domain-containing protein n=1 Tax=Maudiozyma humilis TaxID=51915 RepID=A0AAV5S1W4_MAUHU|nr:hypothetical protein DAKH74_043070 [Kazachstania humilis]
MDPYRIGVATFDTPFTQDKSTLYTFLNTQITAYFEQNLMDGEIYSGFNFHLLADDPMQPQKGHFPYRYDWFTNVTEVFSAWFTPGVTGEYTFSIDTVSDAAAIYIYDNQDMLCCDDMDILGWLPRAVNVMNIPTDPEHTTGPKSTSLEAGKSYLFLMFYINFSGDAELSISVTDPSGQIISDLGPYLGFPLAETCDFIRRTSMIYSLGTDSLTSTYSTSYRTNTISINGVLPVTELETIYYIMTPPVSSSSEIPPSSSAIPSSSSSELLTSFDSSAIESSSEITSSSSEQRTSDEPSIMETSSDITTTSSEVVTSNGLSSSSEVSLSISTLVSSISNSEVSSAETSIHSSSDELPTSSVTSSSQLSDATTDLSITSAEGSSTSAEDIASSSSSDGVDTNGVLPTASSDILSEYSIDSTSNIISTTISDDTEDIETKVPGGSIYQNSTAVSHSSTVESSGHYYASSSGLVAESSSGKEADGNDIGSTYSTGGNTAHTVVRTVTNILGQTTTTVVTCTENVCQPTGRPNEEQNEPKSNGHGGSTVTLSPVVTANAPVATSKQFGVETIVPQAELSSTEKYEGTEVLQVGSNSASSAPTTTFSVVAAPNGSVRIQKCLITSMFSFFLMVLLL